MPVLTRFQLDGGTNQAAARKLLPPEGLLRRVVNMELRRDGELGVRPGFTALEMTRQGQASLVDAEIHDLHVHNGRLFGIGNLSSHTSDNMTVLWEYVGAVDGWRTVSGTVSGGGLMPHVIDVRDIAATPEIADGVSTMTAAASGGLVLIAYDTADTRAYARVVRALDDVAILSTNILGTAMVRPMAMVATSGLFHIVGVNAAGTALSVRSFDSATDEVLSTATTLFTVDSLVFSAAAVLGSPGGYVTVGTLAGDLVVRHYNDSHAQQMTVTIAGVAPTYVSIAANGPQNRITIVYTASSVVSAVTIRLDNGGNIVGPGAVFLGSITTTSWCSVKYNTDTSINAYTIIAHITSESPEATWIITGNDTGFGGGSTFGSRLIGSVLTAEMVTVNPTGAAGASPNYFGVRLGDTDQITTALAQADGVHFFKDFGTAFAPAQLRRIGSHVRDASTGLFYMVNFTADTEGLRRAVVTEYRAHGIRRVQSASAGGLLYFAGGLPSVCDGLHLVEQVWGNAPVLFSVASSNAGGSVTAEAAYFIQCHAEWKDARGDVHKGPPSLVKSITTGVGHNRITGSVAGLHSLKYAPSLPEGLSFRIVIHRTAALADKTAGENLYRETSISIPITSPFGDALSFVLTASDDDLRELGASGGTIYTQGQTPIPNQAPPPCRYVWPIGERLAVAGLPRVDQWLQSKLLFPGEPISFADLDIVQFQGRAQEDIQGIAGLGGNLIVFCRRSVHFWQGDGPDHSGQGSFTYAGCLSREGGLIEDGWRSLVETDDGVFFQRDDEQICLVGAGGVQWVGQAIRDELVTYPVVAAAAFLRERHSVAFALQNAAGDAGEVVAYDLRRKVWFVHDLGVVDAVCEYQGRLAYCTRAGAVFLQNAAPGSGAMPTQIFETFDFDFGTGLSWGEAISFGLIGTKKGDATAALAISYDSGDSYTTIETFAVTTAGGYTTGKPFELKKAIPNRDCSRFAIKLTISGGSDTEGLRINEVVLETDSAPGMARLPARDAK